MKWVRAAFARLTGVSVTASPARDPSAAGTGLCGPAPSIGPRSRLSGARHLVERRARRMRGNRSAAEVAAWLARHRALLTSEGRDAG